MPAGTPDELQEPGAQFDEHYYRYGCGGIPYEHSEFWLKFFF